MFPNKIKVSVSDFTYGFLYFLKFSCAGNGRIYEWNGWYDEPNKAPRKSHSNFSIFIFFWIAFLKMLRKCCRTVAVGKCFLKILIFLIF